MDLRLASINVRGLNKTLKRKSIFNYCNNFHIICLQETHIVKQTAEQWKREWGGCLLFSEDSSSSKGQVILINKSVAIESIYVSYQTNRILAINIKIKDYTNHMNIVNVYGPNNGHEKVAFIDSLYAMINTIDDCETYIAGDFNIVFDNHLDIVSGAFHREEICNKFRQWVNNCSLQDI